MEKPTKCFLCSAFVVATFVVGLVLLIRIRMSGSEWVASCRARRIGDSGDGCHDDWHMCQHQDATPTNPAMFTPPIIIPPKE
jgi:hypothetical protein